MHKLTAAQAALLTQARDARYGATASGARRRTLKTLEDAGLVAFVPATVGELGGRPGHVWRPTVDGAAVLKAHEAAAAAAERRRIR